MTSLNKYTFIVNIHEKSLLCPFKYFGKFMPKLPREGKGNEFGSLNCKVFKGKALTSNATFTHLASFKTAINKLSLLFI